MAEFRFIKDDFFRLCRYASTGNVTEFAKLLESRSEEEKKRFGPNTLCPDARYELHSPLVDAARHGQVEMVKFIVEKYGELVNIHKGSKVISTVFYETYYDVSPLVAACTKDANLELVQYLVSAGANVHQWSQWGTPLCVAAQNGATKVANYLIGKGASIDVQNYEGKDPLMMACSSGLNNPDIMMLLMSKGANVHQKAKDGKTVLHLAAQRGSESIVKLLVEDFSVDPLFAPANPLDDFYTPCPLYVAAANGHSTIVSYLTGLPTCPILCKVDAYLLLSCFNDFDSHFKIGLELLASSPKKPVYPPLVEDYGYCKEITTTTEYDTIIGGGKNPVDEVYQKVLVLERCLGLIDTRVLHFLPHHGKSLFRLGYYKEAFDIWHRCAVICKKVLYIVDEYPDRVDANKLLVSVVKVVTRLCLAFHRAFCVKIKIDFEFEFYIDFFISTQIVLQKQEHQMKDKPRVLVLRTLKMFMWWFDSLQSVEGEGGSSSRYRVSESFKQHCGNFVTSFLYLPKGSSILHSFLKYPRRLAGQASLKTEFLDTLLSLGASDAINFPASSKGMRPLHLCSNDASFTKTILAYDPHIDAVNASGETALSCSSKDGPVYPLLLATGPLPLSCFASQSVVAANIPYHLIDLPKHIVKLIELHDPQQIRLNDYFS